MQSWLHKFQGATKQQLKYLLSVHAAMAVAAGLQRCTQWQCRPVLSRCQHSQQHARRFQPAAAVPGAAASSASAAAADPTVDPPAGTLMQRTAWHIRQQGDMDSLQLVEEQMPSLQPGQVLVEVKAWGLNFADVFCALGLYKAAPQGDFIPGEQGGSIRASSGTALAYGCQG